MNEGVKRTSKKFNPLNTSLERDRNVVQKVDMTKFRSINWEARLKRELELLEESAISKKNKDLILRYKNRRLAQGVSIPRVQREVGSLRILCEKYDVELEKLKDEDFLDEVLAQLELAGYKLNTLNEYKKAIRYLLRDILKCPELASRVKRKEPRDNELTREICSVWMRL